MLNKGMTAPDFTLPDSSGTMHSLSEFRGSKVLLYFYSKDGTSGCTRQAQGYAELYESFRDRGVVVIGISKDSTESHGRFIQKYSLPFLLLSDTDHTVLEMYDVWKEKKSGGKISMGTVRTTYLIDENGMIIYANDKVKAAEDAAAMLSLL